MNVFKKISIIMVVVNIFSINQNVITNANTIDYNFKQDFYEDKINNNNKNKLLNKNKSPLKLFLDHKLAIFLTFCGIALSTLAIIERESISNFIYEFIYTNELEWVLDKINNHNYLKELGVDKKNIYSILNSFNYNYDNYFDISFDKSEYNPDWIEKLNISSESIVDTISEFNKFNVDFFNASNNESIRTINVDLPRIIRKSYKEYSETCKENFKKILYFGVYKEHGYVQGYCDFLDLALNKISTNKENITDEQLAKIYLVYVKLTKILIDFSKKNINSINYIILCVISVNRNEKFSYNICNFINAMYFSLFLDLENWLKIEEAITVFDFLLTISDINSLKLNYHLFLKYLCINIAKIAKKNFDDVVPEGERYINFKKLRNDGKFDELLTKTLLTLKSDKIDKRLEVTL